MVNYLYSIMQYAIILTLEIMQGEW